MVPLAPSPSESPPGPPGAARRARDPERTRRAVLAAAAEVFGARGFGGATLRQIADRAGVQQTLVLYHFGSKEGVWRSCVDDLFRRMIETVASESDAEALSRGPDALRGLLRAFVGAAAREPAWLQILLRESTEPGPRLDWLVENHSRSTYEAGIEIIMGAQASGMLAGLPARHVLYIVVGALTFVLSIAPEIRAVTGEDPASADFLDRHVDTLIALLFRRPSVGGASPQRSKPDEA